MYQEARTRTPPLDEEVPSSDRESDVISMIVVNALVDALKLHGGDAALPHDLRGSAAAMREDPCASLPRARLYDALIALRAELGDPALGVTIGDSLTEMSFHFIGPLLATRLTLRDALTTALELKRSLLGGLPWTFTQDGDEAAIGYHSDAEGDAAFRLAAEIAVTALFRNTVHWLGAEGRRSVRAKFSFAAPAHVEAYRAVFGDHVEFEAGFTGITLPTALLDRPRPGASAELARGMREFSERWLPLENDPSWSERVRRVFVTAPSLANVDFDTLASSWGISSRSLRRRLKNENVKLSGLLDEARFARASDLLARRTFSLTQIAEQLGYFEVNSFQRAFKRWAGVSPGQFRRNAHRRLVPVVNTIGVHRDHA